LGVSSAPEVSLYNTSEVVHPYVSAGPALDALSVSNSFVVRPSVFSYSPGITTRENATPVALQGKAAIGLAAGIGLDIHAGVLRFSPEIRYTH
jgi:hypothetical protein